MWRRRYAPRHLAWVGVIAILACSDDGTFTRLLGRRSPVEVPVLMTTELPFRYPPGLYMEGIQDDVTLRLFIDSLGAVVPESIRVAEPAKYWPFDSAAVQGAPRLIFRSARVGERRISYAVLFPVKFRVPNGPPLPQDTAQHSVKP